jgi:hypothetical protein
VQYSLSFKETAEAARANFSIAEFGVKKFESLRDVKIEWVANVAARPAAPAQLCI